ncbi:MAG: hypothetical protein EPN97_12380 [Alphaproteobacteria bacterium]|nr:MAG: hypothetical protein EPN97_12380 [Alphaproteobacteria bacterium]
MTQFALKIFRFFVFIGLLALMAPRAQAADIPAYAGPGSEDLTKTITSGPSPSASEEVPLDKPNIEITALLPWVADTVTGSLNLQPKDYKETLHNAARSFTRDGWVDFTRMLQKYRVITNLQQNDQTVSVVPGSPSLSREDIEDGIYRWSITMPVTINYFSEKDSHTDYIILNLMVVRVPRKDNILGISISKWLEAER